MADIAESMSARALASRGSRATLRAGAKAAIGTMTADAKTTSSEERITIIENESSESANGDWN